MVRSNDVFVGRGRAPAVTLWFLSGNDFSKTKTTSRRGDHWSPAAVGHRISIMTFTRLVDEGFSGDQWSPLRCIVTLYHSTGRHPSDPPGAGHLPSRGGFRVVTWYHSTGGLHHRHSLRSPHQCALLPAMTWWTDSGTGDPSPTPPVFLTVNCQLSTVNSENPGDCTTGIPYGHHTSVRYFPQ